MSNYQEVNGVYYDETKERLSLTLTPTAKKNLDKTAKTLKISRSETVERVFRSERAIDLIIEECKM